MNKKWGRAASFLYEQEVISHGKMDFQIYFHIIVILILIVFGILSVILPEMLMFYENTCC